MAKEYPSDKQEQFMLRLPDGMRDRIKLAAEANHRSMNAEIVDTLEEKYPGSVDERRQFLTRVFFQMLSSQEREHFISDFCKANGITEDQLRKDLNPEVSLFLQSLFR